LWCLSFFFPKPITNSIVNEHHPSSIIIMTD
jgi:hypothetical protein